MCKVSREILARCRNSVFLPCFLCFCSPLNGRTRSDGLSLFVFTGELLGRGQEAHKTCEVWMKKGWACWDPGPFWASGFLDRNNEKICQSPLPTPSHLFPTLLIREQIQHPGKHTFLHREEATVMEVALYHICVDFSRTVFLRVFFFPFSFLTEMGRDMWILENSYTCWLKEFLAVDYNNLPETGLFKLSGLVSRADCWRGASGL